MSSKTKFVRNDKFLEDRELASMLLRLMMAVNDGALANNALEEWTKTEVREKRARYQGGKTYFARIQLGHVFEALDIIREIGGNDRILGLIEGSDAETRESFRKVKAFLDTKDYRTLLRIRNNLSLHYDAKLAVRALDRLVVKRPEDISAMCFGTETLHWHFQLADKVINNIFAKDVLELGNGADVQKEADSIFHRMFDAHDALADFSMHFIRHVTAKK